MCDTVHSGTTAAGSIEPSIIGRYECKRFGSISQELLGRSSRRWRMTPRQTDRAVVQSAGSGFCIGAVPLLEDFQHPEVMQLMLRYTQALITQMSQTAVCNRHHSVDQQLCRWLLLSLDRLPGYELVMTQELIANMLGVRREGVTECALKLQRAGLISYSRGHISILDRKGIEARSCECYAVVKREYDRLLPNRVST